MAIVPEHFSKACFLQELTAKIACNFEYHEYRHPNSTLIERIQKLIDDFFGSRKFKRAFPAKMHFSISCCVTKLTTSSIAETMDLHVNALQKLHDGRRSGENEKENNLILNAG